MTMNVRLRGTQAGIRGGSIPTFTHYL
jgi:hypothetical protein